MNDIIKKHRQMVALRLSQGFQLPTAYQGEGLTKGGDEYNDIEKARVVRQDGDIHPNGKWVWVSSAAGGKGDWRVIKKQKGDNPAPAAKSPKEEAKPADKKDVRDLDGDKIPEGFTYFKGKESVYNWFLLHAGEAWQADLGAGDQVIVAYMPTEIQKQKSWPDDYAFFSADGNYATIRRRNGKDEFEFFLEKEDALEAAQKLIKQSAGSDKSKPSQEEEDEDDD